jgi:hypothetical protein
MPKSKGRVSGGQLVADHGGQKVTVALTVLAQYGEKLQLNCTAA